MTSALAAHPTVAPVAKSAAAGHPWIRTARWDVGWLIGSAAVVPIVLYLVWRGASTSAINLGVTALVGGPHLFSTYTATYLDPRFRKSHRPLLVLAAVVVPAFVVYWTLVDFQILLSIFIFAASLHVLHQNAYLTDVYRRRAGTKEPGWSRFVDYGLLLICIYPVAAYKLVHHDFRLGEVEILIPAFLRTEATYWAVWIVFGALLSTWIVKTLREWRNGLLNVPKTVLISVTTTIAFVVPMAAAGERLQLAFQAVNAWHSIQYLAIVWYLQAVRREHGLVDNPLMQKITGRGAKTWSFYGFCLIVALSLLGLLFGAASLDPLGFGTDSLAFERYYYMGVLSCLLIHYVLDGYLFSVSNRPGTEPGKDPYSVPAMAGQ